MKDINRMICFSSHNISNLEIPSVIKVLKSSYISNGPKIAEFEDALKAYTGAKYCVAVSNATTALHLVMLGLGLKSGEQILTSPITFAASANCALFVGAVPRFVDINDRYLYMDVDRLKTFLKSPSNSKKIKIIVLVHFSGTVADVIEIQRICENYGIYLVEDAAHALGSGYLAEKNWLKVGCSKHSNATIFSFHPVKNITTGEGGAILTNDYNLYQKVIRLRNHGIIRNSQHNNLLLKHYASEDWFYDIPEIGFNARITDIQCALGVDQLKRLPDFIDHRQKLVLKYKNDLGNLNQVVLPNQREGSKGVYHIYPIRVSEKLRGKLFKYLKKNNILCQVHYIPVHLFSFYQKNYGYKWGDFPVSEKYFKECLSLPLHTKLSYIDQSKVIRTLIKFINNQS